MMEDDCCKCIGCTHNPKWKYAYFFFLITWLILVSSFFYPTNKKSNKQRIHTYDFSRTKQVNWSETNGKEKNKITKKKIGSGSNLP